MQLARECQQHADRVLGHRFRMRAASVRQQHRACDQLREHERRDARRGGMDPAQALGEREVSLVDCPAEGHLHLGQQAVRFGASRRARQLDLGKVAGQRFPIGVRQVPDRVVFVLQEFQHVQHGQGMVPQGGGAGEARLLRLPLRG